MALNKPFGLAPTRTLDANAFNQQTTRYFIPSADGSAYNIGDLVISAANADANGVPAVAKAAGTVNPVRGVIVGVEIAPPSTPQTTFSGTALNLQNTGIPAAKAGVNYYVYVIDDPGALFVVQDDGITTGNLIAANANKNSNFTITAGANLTAYSGTVLLSSTIAVTAALIG